MSEIMSRRDLEFLLYEWLDVEALTTRQRYADHSRETFDGVLGLSERLATDLFAPHNRAADLAEPTWDGQDVHLLPEVKKAVDAYAAADLLRLGFDEEHGGLQVPTVVSVAAGAWFAAANIGTTGYLSLTAGNANLLVHHASAELVERFVPPLLDGRFLGTMALSEPQAGSNLADITTRAVPQDDGTYRVFGQKMWISAGDHDLADNIVHLVLAKIPGGPPGTRGISLLLVPKTLVADDGSLGERNDVVLTGINHKMGWRGTVNTAPSFGSGAFTPGGEPGAVGYLVGEPHRGLSYMFTMMNEARIGVGTGGHRAGLHRLPEVAGLCALAAAGPTVGVDPERSPGRPGRARRRTPHAAGAEGVRRGRAGPRALRREGLRRPADRPLGGSAERGVAGPGSAHADREGLAVPVVPGGQQSRHPGARWCRLHPRPRRRAALPGQPAEPDPRRHPRHPGARPARAQGAR